MQASTGRVCKFGMGHKFQVLVMHSYVAIELMCRGPRGATLAFSALGYVTRNWLFNVVSFNLEGFCSCLHHDYQLLPFNAF